MKKKHFTVKNWVFTKRYDDAMIPKCASYIDRKAGSYDKSNVFVKNEYQWINFFFIE